MNLEAWAGSNIGRVRKSNQDSVGCFPELRLFVVADGMGGRAEGEVASRMAVDTLRESLAPGDTPAIGQRWWRALVGHPADTERPSDGPDLRVAIALANQRIYAAGQRQTSEDSSQRGSMGTTVVALVCELEAPRGHWAHVGDSRLYRARDGEVALLTADHTLFGEAYWDAPTVPTDLPHTNRLVRALGIGPTVEVALHAAELRAGDLFLLCSDGVSGMMPADDLRRHLLAGGPLAQIGDRLIEGALAGGGKDNASALLVRVIAD
jgi:serine/threonine protein phosphatase PrpC